MPEKYVGTKPLSPQYSTVSLLALEATNTGGGGSLYGARAAPARGTRPSSPTSPGAPWRAVASFMPHSMPSPAGYGISQRPPADRARLSAPHDSRTRSI